MKPIKCPKCGKSMIQTDTEHKCINCSFARPRFIKADTSNPMFLSVKTKSAEDKKFLEDIMNPHAREHKDIHEDGTVFIRNESGKITGITTMEKICRKLVKEIKGEQE